jgi:hypothetical protein
MDIKLNTVAVTPSASIRPHTSVSESVSAKTGSMLADTTGKAGLDWTRAVATKAAATCVKNPLKQMCETEIDLSKDADPAKPETLSPAFVDALRNYDTREPRVGGRAPSFRLENLNGDIVDLEALLKEKPVVLVTGSVTCSVYRRQAMQRIEELRRDYGKDVHVITLYIEESHPAVGPSPLARGQWVHYENVSDGILIRRPQNAEQRRQIALLTAERFGLSTKDIVVDTMDNKNWENYMHLPNAAYVIGQDGKVTYREPWAFREPGMGVSPKLFDVVSKLTRKSRAH